MSQSRTYPPYQPQSHISPTHASPPQQHSPHTQPPTQQPYYMPPPPRPYPSTYHTIAPSHPASQARAIPRYEQRYDTVDARQDYPDDDFYSDVDYEEGLDGYYDDEETDTTKESDKSMSYVWLYVIGLLTCLTVEVITIILAYFLEIVIVAPLLCSIWLFALILTLCTLVTSHTKPHDTRIRSQLLITFMTACAVAIVCGLVASSQLKQAWYYEAGNYYTQVNPAAPASQYPSAVMTDFAQGSYVGKDYTGMVTSSGTRYCAAPIMGSGPTQSTTPISFWAIDMNCCVSTNTGVASPGHIQATCAHWSDTQLEGEIRRNPTDSWISAAFASNTWYRTVSSDPTYYVELMGRGEHDRRQQKRRLTGYLIVAIGPLVWPVLLMFYALMICMGTCCCGRKSSTATQGMNDY